MHESVIAWGRITCPTVPGRVLEIGSLDVNGSLRPYVEPLADSYVGADIRWGEGVDLLCDVGDLLEVFGSESFDLVICTEVLEHIEDWRSAIHAIKSVLVPGGELLLTTRSPGFPYHPEPEDHWRFTVGDMESIFSDFHILDLQADPQVPGVFIRAARPEEWPGHEADLSLIKPMPILKRGLVSIVIPYHGLHGQTQSCVDSVLACTSADFELILIDNGSEEKKDWPDTLTSAERTVFVHNLDNKPYAAVCNQGARLALGQFVLFLNNDTVVTAGWLTRMLEAMEGQEGVAIVGPVSNRVAGPQQIPVEYGEGEGLAAFGEKIAQDWAGEVSRASAVIGFCMLVRRDVFLELGGFDENLVNAYEDVDLCFRAMKAGYSSCIARSAFVHHNCSQTFLLLGDEEHYWSVMDAGWAVFRRKWKIPGGMSPENGLRWLMRRISPRSGIFYAVMMERAMLWESVDGLLDVAAAASLIGAARIVVPYAAIDMARNEAVRMFRSLAKSPDDVLVMLDADHVHPPDVLERLVSTPVGVVSALGFRRGAPFDPIMFVRDGESIVQPAEFEEAVHLVARVGTGAIAIRAWVFDKLEKAGFSPPFFRMGYVDGSPFRPGEDIGFSELCERAGVHVHCDTRLEIPHLITSQVTKATWEAYQRDRPDIVREGEKEVTE